MGWSICKRWRSSVKHLSPLLPLLLLWLSGPLLLAEDEAATRANRSQEKAETPAKAEQKEELEPLSPSAQAAREQLERELPKDSEGRAMLDDIVKGSRLSPGDGWFRIAVSQTRFDWKKVAARYDQNGDKLIARDEFPGSDADFQRLDRDHSGAVQEHDLNWSDPNMSRAPGAFVFMRGDRDGNGKLTREEFQQLFEDLDADQKGYLALDEVRDALSPPTDSSAGANRPDKPSRSTLVLGLARQEIGSLQPGPNVDEAAPPFELKSLDGETVALSQVIGPKPVVLIFGNFTCGPFRSQSGNLEQLYQRYQDRARFLLVYVREAHPSDGWWMVNNQKVGIDLSQPTSNEQRAEIALRCRKHLDLHLPFLVDDVGDTVGAKYSGMPNRLYVIDGEGRVAFKSGRGPFGFKPGEMEQSLIWLMHDAAPAKVSGAD